MSELMYRPCAIEKYIVVNWSILLLILLVTVLCLPLRADIVGSYKLHSSGDQYCGTTTIKFTKDNDCNYAVSVNSCGVTVEGTDVKVSEGSFSFKAQVATSNGVVTQEWVGERQKGKVIIQVSILDKDQDSSVTVTVEPVAELSDHTKDSSKSSSKNPIVKLTFESAEESSNGEKVTSKSPSDNPIVRLIEEFKFGIGLSYAYLNTPQIASAQIVNQRVRITESQPGFLSPVLEAHGWTHPPCKDKSGLGFFLSMHARGEKVIASAAAGIMFGLPRDKDGGEGFNFGIGYAVHPSVQVLGEGLNANETLPMGEMQVRYSQKTLHGFMLIVSWGK